MAAGPSGPARGSCGPLIEGLDLDGVEILGLDRPRQPVAHDRVLVDTVEKLLWLAAHACARVDPPQRNLCVLHVFDQPKLRATRNAGGVMRAVSSREEGRLGKAKQEEV